MGHRLQLSPMSQRTHSGRVGRYLFAHTNCNGPLDHALIFFKCVQCCVVFDGMIELQIGPRRVRGAWLGRHPHVSACNMYVREGVCYKPANVIMQWIVIGHNPVNIAANRTVRAVLLGVGEA